jgi:hypothetical protein
VSNAKKQLNGIIEMFLLSSQILRILDGLYRCQAFKIAQRKHKGPDGKQYNKGDVVLSGCSVTGTNKGTPAKDKYALKTLWELSIRRVTLALTRRQIPLMASK